MLGLARSWVLGSSGGSFEITSWQTMLQEGEPSARYLHSEPAGCGSIQGFKAMWVLTPDRGPGARAGGLIRSTGMLQSGHFQTARLLQ